MSSETKLGEKTTVKFLGRRIRPVVKGSLDPMESDRCQVALADDGRGPTRYYAATSGPLFHIVAEGVGPTPQKAVTRLEADCFKRFASVGAALGYEVER